jgi:hypothetical protein
MLMVHYQGIGRFARLSPLQVSVLFGFNSGTNVAAYEAEEKPRANVINATEVKVLLFLLDLFYESQRQLSQEVALIVFYLYFSTMSDRN